MSALYYLGYISGHLHKKFGVDLTTFDRVMDVLVKFWSKSDPIFGLCSLSPPRPLGLWSWNLACESPRVPSVSLRGREPAPPVFSGSSGPFSARFLGEKIHRFGKTGISPVWPGGSGPNFFKTWCGQFGTYMPICSPVALFLWPQWANDADIRHLLLLLQDY